MSNPQPLSLSAREDEINTETKTNIPYEWKKAIESQLGAAIVTLENALKACPDELWRGKMWQEPADFPGGSEFWYVAYHALFFLDYYLTPDNRDFMPPVPFTLSEFDPRGLLPDRCYSKDELLAYLELNRLKCQSVCSTLSDAQAQQQMHFPWGELSFGELLLDNMRHTQEHAAQLHMFLGQHSGLQARWVPRT